LEEYLQRYSSFHPRLLYILIFGTYDKFARKNNFSGVLAAGMQDLVYITTEELFRFHNKKFDEMPCKLDHAFVWELPNSAP